MIDVGGVNAVLDGLSLVDLQRADLLRAGSSSWGLRSADAIHPAVALRLEADQMVAYDTELCQAAERAGLTLSTPGCDGAASDLASDCCSRSPIRRAQARVGVNQG